MNIFTRIFRSLMSVSFFIILLGLIFFGIGGGLTYKQFAFEKQAIPVQGEVIGYTEGCDDDGCTYNSVVQFMTIDGKPITYTSTYASSPPAHDVGETVTIYYAPNDPSDAAIKGEGIVFRIIFMVIGGIIMLVGLGIFIANFKQTYLIEE